MSITIPNPWLMLLVFIVFLVTMFLLNTWLFKPLLGFMEERNTAIQNDLQKINNSDAEIAKINDEIKTIFENAKKEANTILENATNEAQAEYESKMLKKQSESQAKLKTFRLDLQEQKKALETEIVAHLPEFEMALQNKIQQL